MDEETQKVFTRLCLGANGSRPPLGQRRFRDLYEHFMSEGTDSTEKWNIIFGLLLDSVRKSSYTYHATQALAEDLLQHDPPVSATDTLGDQISAHEGQLHDQNENWGAIVQTLLDILDDDLTSDPVRERRQNVLNQFANRQ